LADSLHQELVEKALVRLNALAITRPDATVMPWVEREILSPEDGWLESLPNLPCGIISAVGLEVELTADGDTCTWVDAYPLIVRLIDRGSAWDAASRNWRLKVREDIKNAFRGQRLTIAYGTSQNYDVLFLPSATLEQLPEGYQILSSPLFFQLNASLPTA
jgi:hypothetical protein